jgi:hypothetical protein
MVVVAVRAVIAWVILVVMALSADTEGAVLPSLVRSCGGDAVADVQEPGVEELCMEEPFHFW